jgi:hypothetical protein
LRLHIDYSCGQLRNFINRNWIGICTSVADSQVLLLIANGMAMSSRNVHANYEILGFFGFEIPKMI